MSFSFGPLKALAKQRRTYRADTERVLRAAVALPAATAAAMLRVLYATVQPDFPKPTPKSG
jgi:hypothetical protein